VYRVVAAAAIQPTSSTIMDLQSIGHKAARLAV